jgi:hypothetical protein
MKTVHGVVKCNGTSRAGHESSILVVIREDIEGDNVHIEDFFEHYGRVGRTCADDLRLSNVEITNMQVKVTEQGARAEFHS